jgi:hypothetical protein
MRDCSRISDQAVVLYIVTGLEARIVKLEKKAVAR